ncbi:MAG: apolipoprotein N-acyltransferase [Gammaproteobacteria bacterium]|nr:apolipoprotein N-acyltransferase [Gammaproteobacteria bacterium]
MPKVRGIAAILAGGLLPLAFAPFGLYPVAFISLALLFWLWIESTPRQALLLGLLFGIGQFGVGVSWVYVAIHTFGHTVVPLAIFLTSLFVLTLALFPALTGYAVARIMALLPNLSSAFQIILVMPLLWSLLEWVRGWILTGFPWLNLGYSQIDSPLRGWAPVVGVYGLNWIVALVAGIALWWWLQRKQTGWLNIPAIVAIALTLGVGQLLALVEWTTAKGESLSVALVQGNVAQSTKWQSGGLQRRIERYSEMTRPLIGKHQLIVWPENAITQFYHRLDEEFFNPMAESAKAQGSEIVLGVPVLRDDDRYYTSMAVAGDDSRQYHKHHLVPFGEYLPLDSLLRGLIDFFNMPMSDFVSGAAGQSPLKVAGTTAAVTICYEDLFGEEYLSQLPEAEILLNGSNNAWYGDSLAAHQHLEIARMRSLELGRWTLRATTNGITAIINPQGVINRRSPQFEQAVITGEIQPMQGTTPYIIWGNGLVILLMVAGLGVVAYQANRKD